MCVSHCRGRIPLQHLHRDPSAAPDFLLFAWMKALASIFLSDLPVRQRYVCPPGGLRFTLRRSLCTRADRVELNGI